MSRLIRNVLLTSILGASLSCAGPAAIYDAGEVEHPEVELSVLMGEIQRHGAKLGYSIATEHEFLVVLPAEGEPPYLQRFEPGQP